MRKWLRTHFHRHMIRPLIYKGFTRAVLSVFLVLVLDRFVHSPSPLFSKSNLFILTGILWLLGSWISYLRLRGLRFPRFDIQRMRRKDPLRNYGDISDHINDPIITYDDLDDQEKDVCTLLCDLALCPLFIVTSFFF